MMTDDQIIAEFRAAEALLEGHFILSSGLRSPKYLQCARVLMDPARAERLARELAARNSAMIWSSVIMIGRPLGRGAPRFNTFGTAA